MSFFTTFIFALLALQSHALYLPNATVTTTRTCKLPGIGGTFETVDPYKLGINATIVNQAIANASLNGAVSIKVLRNNCLIASSQALYPNVQTDGIRRNLFSATKSVISVLAGIAYDRGLLDLDAPIGTYLPPSYANSWGDAPHRAITVRELLTETAGTANGVISEALTVLLDASIPQEALALPFSHVPGTVFQYSQRVPDLMAYIVSRVVNQELQAFAQANLFDLVGIPAERYVWFRDRSYNTYGFAYLYMTANDFARLGLMLQNGGVYNGNRIISTNYLTQAVTPSPHNGCYGFFFWTNRVSPYSPNVDTCYSPSSYLLHRSWIPSAPRDLFAMAGSPQQKNYIIPSLNMTVSWLTVTTDAGPGNNTYYNFFKTLMPGVLDPGFVVPGPGSAEQEPASLTALLESLEPSVLIADIAASSSCNIVTCNGSIPIRGLMSNIAAILALISPAVATAINNLFSALTKAGGT